MSGHYTAVVEVSKVTSTPERRTGSGYAAEVTPASRTTSEVARIVVRAETLGALRAKVTAHVALLDEEVTA